MSMMARNNEILYISEYLKDVLYFAIVKPGKTLKNTFDTHYFTIDNDLVYENYYSDFGPLNLGCVYQYCKLLNEKFKQFLNKQTIVHYTSADPKKKANAAFLLGCFGVLYLSLPSRDALKPLLAHGQNYRPFQDATQGDSVYTITIMDCLQAIKKARELSLFNFQDFNFEEYDRLDKIQGGDLNWIVPGKFLAFIGPVDYSVSLYHPPEMYIDYFKENNVKLVIRLNKRLYDGNVFRNSGIEHYDLFFPDGSCPPRHILFKFLQISEEVKGAIAVHCKAGLGRTGSLIGCYLIKHYRMTAHEAIGWMRICRPGSVIGHQQGWLTQLEPWLLKQGNIYRKRMYQDVDRLPCHEYGVYSIAEKSLQTRPVVYSQSPPSSPPSLRRHGRSESKSPVIRPQASKVREESNTEDSPGPSPLSSESHNTNAEINDQSQEPTKFWKWLKWLFNTSSYTKIYDFLWWWLAVRSTKYIPRKCQTCCFYFDMAALHKISDHESPDRRLNTSRNSLPQALNKGDLGDKKPSSTQVRRGSSGAGEPRNARTPMSSTSPCRTPGNSIRSTTDGNSRCVSGFHPMPPFRPTQTPVIKNMNDARNFLMKNGMYEEEKLKKTNNSCITVTPQYSSRTSNVIPKSPVNTGINTPSIYSTAQQSMQKARVAQPMRRRLGRSPSPPSVRVIGERSRATNTPPAHATPGNHQETHPPMPGKRNTLKEAVSGLLFFVHDPSTFGAASVGAASLGARRDAPAPRSPMRAPSVRSDERPLATQGDMLNSIKLQRRLRDTLAERPALCREKPSGSIVLANKDRVSRRNVSLKSVELRGPKPLPLSAVIQQESRSVLMNMDSPRHVNLKSVQPRQTKPLPWIARRDSSNSTEVKNQLFKPRRPSVDRRPYH